MNILTQKFLDRFPTRPSVTRRYLYAFALMVVALIARLQIAPVEGGIQYVTFFPAVALSAIIGGFWPGLFAAAIGIVLAAYFFWPPYYAFNLTFRGESTMAHFVFFLDAILVSSAIEAMHRLHGISVETNVQRVAEHKAAEEDLRAAKLAAERANDAKSRFLAAVSHDLRQPLSALSLYVAALKGKLPSANSELQANMQGCVEHLNEMLSNLLDLSRLEAGVIKPDVKDFDLDALLAKIVAAHGPEARARGLALRVVSSSKIGRTDPVLFQRMIGNLLANAIRYTRHGGVLVGTRRHDRRVWVEVWDTGIGIAAEGSKEIFEEFTQLGNMERNVAKGSGLGLAIVARTAALLGVQIRMHSELGKGSMFAVELPLGEALPVLQPSSYPQRRLRIALVEDNAEVAAALVYALTENGHQVVPAVSRLQVVDRLGGIPPDIVISDYRLASDENGLNVIAHLRSLFGNELPAMIITGDTAPSVLGQVAREHVRVHHKPIDLEVLRTTMAELTRDCGEVESEAMAE